MKARNEEFFRKDEKIAVIHSVWSPELKSHNHDFFEIAFITKGSGYHVLNNNRHPIQSGALFLITPNSEHTLIAETQPFEWINVLFFPSVINSSLGNLVSTSDILKAFIASETLFYDTTGLSNIELENDTQKLRAIFEEMDDEFTEQQAGYQNVLKAYLEVLLVKIFRAYFYNPSAGAEISQKVLNYLREKSYHSEFDLAELAKRTFYSPQYFRKIFKTETGIPLSTFIRQKRLEYAKQLLETTPLSISAVMEKAGFHDTKSFYAAFKNVYGKTPAAIRDLEILN